MSSTDIDTLRAFYVASRQQLYTYAVSITRNREAAEDAIHGVFLQLLRRGTMPTDLRPYLFRSIRNAALDAWRQTKVRGDSLFLASIATEAVEPAPSPPFQADELDRLLHNLSPDERETIVLKIYSDLTFQEIADLRQVRLFTVASWYRRGLEKMKSMLTTEH